MWELRSFTNADELAATVAGLWVDEISAPRRAGESQCVALSGGRIARSFFSAVALEAKKRAVSLGGIHFFWADERCVPPDDNESNYRIARELLFEPLKIPGSHVHRIWGEEKPESAAESAEAEIRGFAPVNEDNQPVLNWIFLGLGDDGHIASLFPGEAASVASDQAVYRAVLNSPKPPPHRITLGYPVIAAAGQVWMLASGEGKEGALRSSLSPDGRTPFARVLSQRSHTKIFTDIRVA